MAVLALDGMQAVAPTATIVAAARAYEDCWLADQGALDRWPEYLGHPQGHGLYSAHVFGVSLTKAALVSGQRALHQS